MNLLIIGGDMRGVFAAELLAERGHSVTAFSTVRHPHAARLARDVREAAADADAILLPIPAVGTGGVIRGTDALLPGELLSVLSPGRILFGGNLSASLVASARERGIKTVDYLNCEAFVLQNAYLTAQAALGILLRELPVCLFRTKIAVIGFGRIGKFLARMLHTLGAEVTVLARRPSDLVMASLIGVETKPLSALDKSDALSFARAIVNTAPARLIKSEHLLQLAKETLLLELASGSDNIPPLPPDRALSLIVAQGLPGKCYPNSAGQIVAEATEEVLSAL